MTNTAPCPHCGRTTSANEGYSRHVSRCDYNPDVRAAIVSLLADPTAPGHARPQLEYDALAKEHRTTRAQTLVARYRSWPKVCAEFGLRLNPRHRTKGDMGRNEAEIDAEIAHARAMVVEARTEWASSGLPVCRVREIDGGRRLAWEVR